MVATIEPAIASPRAQPKVNQIENLQKTISASRLILWLSCRLKFFFRYVQEIQKPKTPSLHVGQAVHEVLKVWNMCRWKKQAFELQRFKSLFESAWVKQESKINWDGEEIAQKNTAWSLLETYFTETPIKTNEMPEAVEVPIDADLSKHGLPTLIGVLDLVRAGGRIVDFKTSGKSPSAEDAIHLHEVQLSCYSVLYREATGKPESGRELHHLVKTKQPKLVITTMQPMSESQQVRLFRLMDSYQEGLAREDFVPSPGLQCCGCEFRPECNRWC